MAPDVNIVGTIKQQLADHMGKMSNVPFSPASEESAALGRLTRELEIKRQTGTLTDAEKTTLEQIDKLLSEISE